jgi:hypothetical protein
MPAFMHNVFSGKTASITLAKSGNPDLALEATDSSSVANAYFGSDAVAVGRATGIQVSVQTGLHEFHEVGARLPVVLHPGDISISGAIDRAYISGALVTLLLGRGAALLAEPFVQPAFDIIVHLKDPAVAGPTGTTDQAQLVLHGVKFHNWSFRLPEDDFVMENVTFRALSLEIVDQVFATPGASPTPVKPFAS